MMVIIFGVLFIFILPLVTSNIVNLLMLFFTYRIFLEVTLNSILHHSDMYITTSLRLSCAVQWTCLQFIIYFDLLVLIIAKNLHKMLNKVYSNQFYSDIIYSAKSFNKMFNTNYDTSSNKNNDKNLSKPDRIFDEILEKNTNFNKNM